MRRYVRRKPKRCDMIRQVLAIVHSPHTGRESRFTNDQLKDLVLWVTTADNAICRLRGEAERAAKSTEQHTNTSA